MKIIINDVIKIPFEGTPNMIKDRNVFHIYHEKSQIDQVDKKETIEFINPFGDLYIKMLEIKTDDGILVNSLVKIIFNDFRPVSIIVRTVKSKESLPGISDLLDVTKIEDIYIILKNPISLIGGAAIDINKVTKAGLAVIDNPITKLIISEIRMAVSAVATLASWGAGADIAIKVIFSVISLLTNSISTTGNLYLHLSQVLSPAAVREIFDKQTLSRLTAEVYKTGKIEPFTVGMYEILKKYDLVKVRKQIYQTLVMALNNLLVVVYDWLPTFMPDESGILTFILNFIGLFTSLAFYSTDLLFGLAIRKLPNVLDFLLKKKEIFQIFLDKKYLKDKTAPVVDFISKHIDSLKCDSVPPTKPLNADNLTVNQKICGILSKNEMIERNYNRAISMLTTAPDQIVESLSDILPLILAVSHILMYMYK